MAVDARRAASTTQPEVEPPPHRRRSTCARWKQIMRICDSVKFSNCMMVSVSRREQQHQRRPSTQVHFRATASCSKRDTWACLRLDRVLPKPTTTPPSSQVRKPAAKNCRDFLQNVWHVLRRQESQTLRWRRASVTRWRRSQNFRTNSERD